MMLIEREIERKLRDYLAELLPDCEVIGSWQPADAGKVKGENDNSAKALVSLYIQPRVHDAFSLPTANLNGSIAIEAKAQKCPTMAEVSEVYEKVEKLLDDWHFDGAAFSSAMSIDGEYFAAEIRLDGGDSVTFDRANAAWVVALDFTIRGTVLH